MDDGGEAKRSRNATTVEMLLGEISQLTVYDEQCWGFETA